MVCWNVKPSILAIDEEDILFRGFVVPAHLARALEVGFASLQSGQRTVLRIALEKGSLETSGTPVPRL
jgi:NhaP-type Na+/H+ or K+/H+ antiporter